ncbi:hypothetical protein SAMN05518847_112129 [Paenibacillus sp. OV219]|nr:hypothetical protein SAMN05518847_112129 [Paenibacillus sp. OV219]
MTSGSLFFTGNGREADRVYVLGTEGSPTEVQYEKPSSVRFEPIGKSLL